jgi:hypothetical protein
MNVDVSETLSQGVGERDATRVRHRSLPRAGWIWWGIAAGVGYLVSARLAGAPWHPGSAYFDELADAFLHGRLHLADPCGTHDLTQYDGRWFVPFPPLPALLMLPFVAVLGVDGMSTLVFVAAMGAVNVALVHLLLRSLVDGSVARLDRAGVHWLTAAWAFGSVHWYMATQGSVWFTAQICAATFVLAALVLAVRGRSAWAASMVAVAMLSRPTLAMIVPAVVALAMHQRAIPWRRAVGLVAAPVATAVAVLAAHNSARFGSVTDFGYTTQNVARELERDLRQRGQFSLSYVKHNMWAAFAAGPTWDPRARASSPNPDGMSILLTTPAVLLTVRAARGRVTAVLVGGGRTHRTPADDLLQHRLVSVRVPPRARGDADAVDPDGDRCRRTPARRLALGDRRRRRRQLVGPRMVRLTGIPVDDRRVRCRRG